MKKTEKLTMNELSELRDRARLLEYSTRINHPTSQIEDIQYEKEKLRHFIQFVNILESIIVSIIGLYISGHFLVSDLLEGKQRFSCIQGNYDQLTEQSNILKRKLKDWEKELCKSYEGCPVLTHLSGEEFWEVEDYIHTRSSPMHPGYHLLKYMNIDISSKTCPNQRRVKPEDRSR